MGASARKKSALERRLRDLEKERERVSGDIKVLSRALKKADEGTPIREIPRLKTRPEPPAPQAVPAVAPEVEAPAADAGGDLFTQEVRPTPEAPAAPPAPAPSERPQLRQKPTRKVEMDQRLASYLTSGSFFPATPIKEDRNVTRNKAIFMVIFVIIVAFIVYTLSQYL